MNTLPGIAVSLGILAVLAGCASGPPGDEDVAAAITGAWRDHIAAAMRKDAAGVVAMYAADAVFALPDGTEVRGLPALGLMEAESLSRSDVVDAVHTTHALRIHDGAAYELGTVAGPVRPRGGEAREVFWNFMAQWRRQPDGAWRIRYLVGQ